MLSTQGFWVFKPQPLGQAQHHQIEPAGEPSVGAAQHPIGQVASHGVWRELLQRHRIEQLQLQQRLPVLLLPAAERDPLHADPAFPHRGVLIGAAHAQHTPGQAVAVDPLPQQLQPGRVAVALPDRLVGKRLQPQIGRQRRLTLGCDNPICAALAVVLPVSSSRSTSCRSRSTVGTR